MKRQTNILAHLCVTSLLIYSAACTGSHPKADSPPDSRTAATAASQNSGTPSVEANGSVGDTVVIKTNKGEITVELNREKAPISVANFLSYVDKGFYDGTIFHRVIPGFMIQGGGFDTGYKKKPTDAAVKNEAGNGLTNDNGTIAMARTSVVDSATSQFFINLVDNRFLNHKSDRANEYGYAVFGKVVDGADVVKSIAAAPTGNRGGPFTNAPIAQVVIESIRRK